MYAMPTMKVGQHKIQGTVPTLHLLVVPDPNPGIASKLGTDYNHAHLLLKGR